MKHVSTQDISEFLDGTLSVSRMRDTAIHMDRCAECKAEFEAWKKTRAMLRRAPKSVSPGPDFWSAATARLIEEDRSPARASLMPLTPALSFKTSTPSFTTRIATGLGSAAALVGIVFLIGHSPVVTPGLPTAIAPISGPTDIINDDDVSSFVRAHTEAAAALPLADGSRQIMLAADVDDTPDSSSGDTTTNVDSNL